MYVIKSGWILFAIFLVLLSGQEGKGFFFNSRNKNPVTTPAPAANADDNGNQTEKPTSRIRDFARNGFKDIPILNVLQDVVVKTADNVANLPGNLVEDVKSGNPLNVIKSTLKVLPLVDESLVDRAVNAVQDRIENLPNTIVEGVKQGANLLNTTTAVTGNLIGNVVKPLGNVVSNGLEKGASLINTTGHIVGKVAKPLVGVVGTGFKGVLDLANATGQVTKKVIDTTTGTLDLLNPANLINKLLLTLGLPVLIVIGVVVLIVVLCFLGLCTWGIVSCVKSKKNSNTKSVYKSEKPSITIKEDVEASQKLLSE